MREIRELELGLRFGALTFAWHHVAWTCGLTIALVVLLADTGNLQPLIGLVHSVRHGDKLGHFLLMGLLAWTVARAVGVSQRQNQADAAWLAARAVFAVVLLEELSQLWIPTRTFDPLDLAADAAGILLGARLARRSLVQARVSQA